MTLSIGTFRVDGAVSADHPEHSSAERQLDDVVRDRLPSALDRLGASMLGSDQTVILIRTLAVDLDLDLAEPGDMMADRLAVTVWDRIAAARHDGDNVLVFRSPAEHLAVFLIDLVDGRAWSQWYHRRFSGLALVSTSAVIRTLVIEDPVTFSAAAALLPRTMLERVVATVNEPDATTALAALGSAAPVQLRKALGADTVTVSSWSIGDDSPAEPDDMSDVRFTAFAGAFLLLPSLLACPATSARHASAARFLAVTSALGRDVSADPVIGEILTGGQGSSVEPTDETDPPDWATWLTALGHPDEAVDLGSLGTADDFLALRTAVGPDIPTLIVAAVLIRRFATGLFGMAESSVSYLRDAFLGTGGRVTRRGDRLVVAIETPPLWMLLKLSGFDGRTIALPWNSELSVHLSLEQA